jgi:hypothetical protein
MIKKILHYILAFIISILIASVLACIFSTHFVLEGLHGIGVEINLTDRLLMTIFDLGMIRILGIVFACCFLAAFIVAAICHRFLPGNRTFWFSVGGATSIGVLLFSFDVFLGGMPIAGARTLPGLFFQCLAGGLGGWLFAKMSSLQDYKEAL